MSKVVYEVVQHDGGWAYKVGDVLSETFPSHAAAHAAAAAAASQEAARAAARRSEPADLPTEDEDALPAIEGEDEPEAAEEDETFLEPEEEDGADMENIIGGPVAETDEPQ